MWPNPQFPVDLVAFTEEILNEKLHFFIQRLVDLVVLPESQIEFSESWKLWQNICSCKWLKPTLSLIRWVEPKELGKLKLLLGRDLLNSKNHSFKSLSEEEERLFESNLFHYIIMINKKSVFKEFVIGFDWRQFLRVTIRICRWWLRNSMGK